MQKIIYMNQIQDYSNYIDQAVIDYINERQIESFEAFQNFDIFAFDYYDVTKLSKEPEKIMIYIDADDLFYFCENEGTYEIVSKYFETAETNERSIYLFFSNLLKGSNKMLEELEDKIDAVDAEIMTGTKVDNRNTIVRLRNKVLRLKKYYDQFNLIFDELCQNDNSIITKEGLKSFKILKNRSRRLTSTIQNLREYITQVRESYQAQIDIEQNKLMKFFTITTTIFLPLTLITGWYGMNLKMPEFTWDYGYIFVIVLFLIVSMLWFLMFKKKKWF